MSASSSQASKRPRVDRDNDAQHQSSTQPHKTTRGNRKTIFTVNDATELYNKSTRIFDETSELLDEARNICHKAGLTVDANILDASYQSPFLSTYPGASSSNKPADGIVNNIENPMLNAYKPILSTTGGHSNTDHIIQVTGDYRADTIAEYKRRLKRRARAMKPEERGSDRWDLPRIQGSRRRRILREKDLPTAPPEPPPSGYVLFVAMMTCKIRHDRPNAHHDQIRVVKEISKIWKYAMTDADRDYYIDFAAQAKEEYDKQHEEFRATGSYKPSKIFTRLGNDANGPWVRIAHHEKNALEREISSYKNFKFPPRPEKAEKPAWVTKVELQVQRGSQQKRAREEKLKKERKQYLEKLKKESKQKMQRLTDGALTFYK